MRGNILEFKKLLIPHNGVKKIIQLHYSFIVLHRIQSSMYVSIENSIQTNMQGNILEFRKLLIPLLYIATSVNLYTVQCSYSLSKMAHRLVLQLIQMTLLLYSTQRCFLTLSCSIKTFKKFNFFQINTNSELLLFVIYNLE